VHGKGPRTSDINWLFVAPKFKKMAYSFWKNILDSWLNIRAGLVKIEPASCVEVFRQPIFNNLLITNTASHPLGVNGLNEGNTIAKIGYTRIKDLWDLEDRDWKSHPAFWMNSHIINRTSRRIIIDNIP
jgi:hypothetical protein